MNNKTEQNPVTTAITEIKEQVQIEQWQKDIEDRQAAGFSIAAFCERRGISKSTYYYRLRKVREHLCYVSGILPEKPQELSNEQQIVPIRVAAKTATESRIEIVGGDLRISFTGETDLSALKVIIEALRSC